MKSFTGPRGSCRLKINTGEETKTPMLSFFYYGRSRRPSRGLLRKHGGPTDEDSQMPKNTVLKYEKEKGGGGIRGEAEVSVC